MRPATPHDGYAIAHLVLPDDVLSDTIWEQLVVAEGGEAELSEMAQWNPTEFLTWFLRDRQEAPVEEPPETGAGRISGYDDSHGHVGSMDYYELATQLLERLPKMAAVYTKPEIASILPDLGFHGTPHQTPRSAPTPLEQQIAVLQDAVNFAARDKTTRWMHARLGPGQYTQHVFATMSRTIFNRSPTDGWGSRLESSCVISRRSRR